MTNDIAPHEPSSQPIYLGDGVYAEFDGWQVWIWTSDGIRNNPKIALRRDVLQLLIAYAKKVGGLHK